MILVDSNVPVHLVGADDPHEVLQEILHPYVAIHRRDAIQPALDAILSIVNDVVPIEAADILLARDVLLGSRATSARDAVHVAVMRRHGINRILSSDRGFDGVPGLRRTTT